MNLGIHVITKDLASIASELNEYSRKEYNQSIGPDCSLSHLFCTHWVLLWASGQEFQVGITTIIYRESLGMRSQIYPQKKQKKLISNQMDCLASLKTSPACCILMPPNQALCTTKWWDCLALNHFDPPLGGISLELGLKTQEIYHT